MPRFIFYFLFDKPAGGKNYIFTNCKKNRKYIKYRLRQTPKSEFLLQTFFMIKYKIV